jgi:signal transduction histidine kinase
LTTWVVRGLLAAVLAVGIVVGTLLLPQDRIYGNAAQVADLATYPVLLAGAALLYVWFRLTSRAEAAWLATAAVFGTAQGVGYAALRVVMEDQVRARPAWLLLTQVVVVGVLCLMLTWSGRVRPPVDPIVLGLALAVVVTGVRLVLVDRFEPAPLLRELEQVLSGLLLLLYGALGLLLTKHVRVPKWVGIRLAAVVVLLGIAQVLTYPVPVEDSRSLAVVALDIGGSALLVLTTLELVRRAIARRERTQETLRRLEAHRRDDRTLLHEVAGTVAGISAATRLLSTPARLAPAERRRLEELLIAETARVDRLLSVSGIGPESDELVNVDLDAMIGPLLFAHGIRGRVVAWHPTGHHVLGRRDDLVEVLDRLLDNADRHASSPILAITVVTRGATVEVSVEDQGPGIPREIADSVLDWGTRGGSSNGEGIGLNVAQRLVSGMHGHLRIESDAGIGTRVVVSLPSAQGARADRAG